LAAGLFGLVLCRRHRICAGLSIAANAVASAFALALAWHWLRAESAPVYAVCDWFILHGDMVMRVGSLLDPLSLMMAVVVSCIALLVSIYSIGYMHDDASAGRFQALLSLFVAAMLALVLAPGLGQLFVAWELVGVTSYLLIGFWWKKPEAVAASKKAFIVTRFADGFFLAGLILLGLSAGSLDFATLLTHRSEMLTVGTALVFVGAWGKSAMFPLHIWLPDAMEGPTPVSSIIHSATMVVAGIFLTARMFPLADAGGTLVLAEVTGAVTALFAALVACVQTDIKRILAFSTLSQLGYMMFALGVASSAHPDGYTASLYHVFTHAWFKCMLFLAAGMGIHAVHSNSLLHMGGLRKYLPLTWLATLIGCLAISGIFPFAGFFSKDAILAAAWTSGHTLTFAVGLVTSGLTAFYMFRLFLLTFHGQTRAEAKVLAHVHEDRRMAIPMIVLAVMTVLAGWPAQALLTHQLVPSGATAGHGAHPLWLPWLATAVGLAGIGLAYLRYGNKAQLSPVQGWRMALHEQLGSNIVWRWIVRKILGGIAVTARFCDETIIDGALRLCASGSQSLGSVLRGVHNGAIIRYLGLMLIGALVILALGHWF
jgi:NADH-quinone oxidoreductase subunit L